MYSAHSPSLGDCEQFQQQQQHAYSASLRGRQLQQQQHSPAASHHLYQHPSHHHQQQQFSVSPTASYSTTTTASAHHLSSMTAAAAAAAAVAASNSGGLAGAAAGKSSTIKCLRFKYFTTFFVCTTCLALLAASLATHKWLVSRPMRFLRLAGGQPANFTALKLTLAASHVQHEQRERQSRRFHIGGAPLQPAVGEEAGDLFAMASAAVGESERGVDAQAGGQQQQQQQLNNKFQGEIYFGLFNGVKVLNHGFGDRVSQLSVLQSFQSARQTAGAADSPAAGAGQSQHELVNFKLWLTTLAGVLLAILFALIGSIFAIINFVMTPRGTMTGPVGLVIWNAAACFACLLAMFAWLVEYFVRLKANVLTPEELQNGWTSENRSQFGYSYYFVVLAFVLHLVNIFIVSIVQAETWTNHSSKAAAKRQSRAAACEGVIMLY